MNHRELNTYGYVPDSRVTYLFTTESEPLTQHFGIVMNRVNPHTKEVFLCAYASVPKAWWDSMSDMLLTDTLITFMGCSAPWLEVGREWDSFTDVVPVQYWVGWDWMHLREDRQYDFKVIHRLVQQNIEMLKQGFIASGGRVE